VQQTVGRPAGNEAKMDAFEMRDKISLASRSKAFGWAETIP